MDEGTGPSEAARHTCLVELTVELIVDSIVDYDPHMETVQVVLDKGLLRAADQAARRTRVNRSALIREALREHLRRLEIQEMEARERRAYRAIPDNNEFRPLQRITAWPED